MIVSIDCGDKDDIHPVDKEPIGYRLSLLGRNMLYHQDVDYLGPTVKDIEFKDDKVMITFNTKLVVKGKGVTGFTLCGENQIFYDAVAEMNDNKITLNHPEVKKPVAVRYAWCNYPEVSIYNANNLPTMPFRTDQF
jgi:sialate O-acetylesterase